MSGTRTVKLSGMFGHMFYSSVKGSEFNKILRQTMTKEEFDAYTARPVSQATPSSFSDFWRRTSGTDPTDQREGDVRAVQRFRLEAGAECFA